MNQKNAVKLHDRTPADRFAIITLLALARIEAKVEAIEAIVLAEYGDRLKGSTGTSNEIGARSVITKSITNADERTKTIADELLGQLDL